MKKYLQYTSTDFSQEPSFIRWTKGIPYRNDMDWDVWQKKHSSKYQEILEAQIIVNSFKFKSASVPQGIEDQLWNKINAATTDKHIATTTTRRKILRLIPYGIASSLALFIIFSINSGTEHTTSLAEVRKIMLPDGSEVIVNASSKISYDEKKWSGNREVYLNGEAFFDVKKGSQFTVITEYGKVSVLGTSFNVYARNNNFNVVCETGKVGVTASDKQTILIAQQGVEIFKGQHKISTNVESKESRTNWIKGIFVYKDSPVKEAISELERQLDITIKIDKSLTNQGYSGSFNKNNLEDALSEVFWPLGLKFKIDGRNIIVNQ